MLYITSFVSIYTEYCNFLYLCVIVQAQGALRDRRYFFLTNNLRFVKIFLQMRIRAFLLKICKIINHQKSCYILPHLYQFTLNIAIFCIYVL